MVEKGSAGWRVDGGAVMVLRGVLMDPISGERLKFNLGKMPIILAIDE